MLIRNDLASLLSNGVEEIFLMLGRSEFHILGAAPENALSKVFFLLKHEGFRSRLSELLKCPFPPDIVSFWDRYWGYCGVTLYE